jgi:hypothetical protein
LWRFSNSQLPQCLRCALRVACIAYHFEQRLGLFVMGVGLRCVPLLAVEITQAKVEDGRSMPVADAFKSV